MLFKLSELSIKKYVIRTIIITLMLICIANILLLLNPYNDYDNNYGISIYFSLMSVNRNVIFFISYTLLIPIIVLMDYYDYVHNKFYYLILERIGIKTYYRNSIINIFVITFVSTLFINISLLLSIGFLWSNISFEPQHIYNLFSENTFINFSLYLILSSLGTSFFSISMFSLIGFIKNKYIFIGFTTILTFTSIIMCTVFGPIISMPLVSLFENMTVLKTIIFSIVPSGLLTPGMIFESFGFLNFTCSLVFYSLFFIAALHISEKVRRKYG